MDTERFVSEAKSLVQEGRELLVAAAEEAKEHGSFKLSTWEYESWYSRASRLVKQILPDRYQAFSDLYKLQRRPSKIDIWTYTISDFLGGVHLVHHDSGNLVATKVMQQLAILLSVVDAIPSRVSDISNIVRAELFDEELAVARELTKRGHLRGAGAVAGVVLERHLKRVVGDHAIQNRKKNPTLADLNDLLKNADVYDVPTWRRIQLLADIRNLAVHEKERAPTEEEIIDLILGVERAIKSIF